VALALDYDLMGDGIAPAGKTKALAFYKQAAELWESLRDSGGLPPCYATKPDELLKVSSH
jgi:hypothetical protein